MSPTFEMDLRTEEIFRQMLNISLDKPLPPRVKMHWRMAKSHHDRANSGGPISIEMCQMICLLHSAGVMVEYASVEEKKESKKAKDG